MASFIQTAIWDEKAKPRDVVIILRLTDAYGLNPFTAKISELAEMIGVGDAVLTKSLVRLKKLGWIKWKRVYEGNHGHLPLVSGCEYVVTLKKVD
jgi:hypothetical protein